MDRRKLHRACADLIVTVCLNSRDDSSLARCAVVEMEERPLSGYKVLSCPRKVN